MPLTRAVRERELVNAGGTGRIGRPFEAVEDGVDEHPLDLNGSILRWPVDDAEFRSHDLQQNPRGPVGPGRESGRNGRDWTEVLTRGGATTYEQTRDAKIGGQIQLVGGRSAPGPTPTVGSDEDANLGAVLLPTGPRNAPGAVGNPKSARLVPAP